MQQLTTRPTRWLYRILGAVAFIGIALAAETYAQFRYRDQERVRSIEFQIDETFTPHSPLGDAPIIFAHLAFLLSVGMVFGCLAGRVWVGLVAAIAIPIVIIVPIAVIFLMTLIANKYL